MGEEEEEVDMEEKNMEQVTWAMETPNLVWQEDVPGYMEMMIVVCIVTLTLLPELPDLM